MKTEYTIVMFVEQGRELLSVVRDQDTPGETTVGGPYTTYEVAAARAEAIAKKDAERTGRTAIWTVASTPKRDYDGRAVRPQSCWLVR